MEIKRTKPAAIAEIRGSREFPGIRGTVKFYRKNNGTLVVADISGLPLSGPQIFGFHIHEGYMCGDGGFEAAGGHLDLENTPHPEHTGDLPPLFGAGGKAYLAVITGRFSVTDVIGRTVVIHSDPDDFTSQPAGNSGARIACGVIMR